jgi:hypothetical protein
VFYLLIIMNRNRGNHTLLIGPLDHQCETSIESRPVTVAGKKVPCGSRLTVQGSSVQHPSGSSWTVRNPFYVITIAMSVNRSNAFHSSVSSSYTMRTLDGRTLLLGYEPHSDPQNSE